MTAHIADSTSSGELLLSRLRTLVDVTELWGSISDLVAARIKEVRKGKGLNVPRLAELCAGVGAANLTESVLMNIESGRKDPEGRRRRDVTADEVVGIARALEVSPLVLVLPADDAEYPLAPGQAAMARHVYEWIIGTRLSPKTADDADVVSDDERAEAWSLLTRSLSYVGSQAGNSATQAVVDRMTEQMAILSSTISTMPAIEAALADLKTKVSEMQSKLSESEGEVHGESEDQVD
ncbi:MAG TPA: hypothetical protein VGH89_31965 [Pseudonocardia sp.]